MRLVLQDWCLGRLLDVTGYSSRDSVQGKTDALKARAKADMSREFMAECLPYLSRLVFGLLFGDSGAGLPEEALSECK